MPTTTMRDCRAWAPAVVGRFSNGGLPRAAAQSAMRAMFRSERLTPAGPKRTAAHSSRGRNRTRAVEGTPGGPIAIRPGSTRT